MLKLMLMGQGRTTRLGLTQRRAHKAKETKTMTDLELLEEWRGLLQRQKALCIKRGKENDNSYVAGLVGILFAKDELALQYQKLDERAWDIKQALFGDLWLCV